jgi:outer membrane beta-barrel protein
MKTVITSILLLASTQAALADGNGEGEGNGNGERRQNDLQKQVAVRHRRLLVKNRLELTPLFESTINADFKHIVGGGVKLEYHFSDMLSIGAIGVGSTAINTKLVTRIEDTLVANPMDPREPTHDQFDQRLNTMPFHGAAYISLTPWYGKLAAFGTAYVAFDFYFQAGVSFASLSSNCDPAVCTDDPTNRPADATPDLNPNNDLPLNSGGRVGLYLGGGIHVFLNDFMALDLTVRDYAFKDNPSGADVSGPAGGPDSQVTNDDNQFLHHLFFGAGVSIMFPTKVKRTN